MSYLENNNEDKGNEQDYIIEDNNDEQEQGLYNLHSLSEEFNKLEKKNEPLNVEELKNNLEILENNEYINNYINDLKEYYTRHLNNSYQNFRKCLNKLEELIRRNGTNRIKAGMLKEIIDDSIFYEREKQIMNFIKEIKETQTQKEKINNELKQNEINNIAKKLENELNKKKNYKKISRELTVTLDKKNSEIIELNKKISILEQEKNESGKLLQKKEKNYKI